MVDSRIHDQLLEQLEHLPRALQQQVLTFARSLGSSPARGVRGAELIRFSGVLDPAEAQAMIDEIEAGCENVDTNGW